MPSTHTIQRDNYVPTSAAKVSDCEQNDEDMIALVYTLAIPLIFITARVFAARFHPSLCVVPEMREEKIIQLE